METKLAEIKPYLQSAHAGLKEVLVTPEIDLAQAVSVSAFEIDCGHGGRSFSSFGEGTKKKLWIGLQDWDRRTADEVGTRNTIRLYDEPDVNLDYESQRKLFKYISELSDDAGSRIQCFVSTHSVHFIDAAHSSSINLIEVEDNGNRKLIRIQGDHQGFFGAVGREVGLTNMGLLFERAFFLVEGPSEAQSIPIIYRNLFGSDIQEDGICIVNLETCGAWRSVLSVLLSSRKDVVHLLPDTDCTHQNSSAKITQRVLNELNCPANFLADQVTFIGVKEFEDAFDDRIWHDAVKGRYILADDTWSTADINALRTADKFSEECLKFVWSKVDQNQKAHNRVTKPELAMAIANQCQQQTDVPAALFDALTAIRTRAGYP